ncbi:hypothetical protein [Pseudaestuariivita rosea]|uniref:hypothetical protein n=1 Tax=Pseudaestuariivita rosea TaxID=2763263 RepID=UPI001ABB2296|nr:hypothetical protein [Pseudaestuariivita rosea]
MKAFRTAVLISALGVGRVLAQDTPEADQGMSLMERGMQMFMEGLMQEMEPAMDEMRNFAGEIEPALRGFVQEMGPALQQLSDLIDDFSNYEAPVILPNGDIIIRRKPDAPLPDVEDGIEI